ncbi:MAG: NADH-quinone oxidoreductase subunit N [Deltaproteobacteria bacterium]|nr:NADH-quinone oxidoreductase subunit N [Deltaproteobacteria bacterium]
MSIADNDIARFLLVTSPLSLLLLGGCTLTALASVRHRPGGAASLIYLVSVALSLAMAVALLFGLCKFNATAAQEWYAQFQRHFYADDFFYGWIIGVDIFLLFSGLVVTDDLVEPDVFGDSLALVLFSGCGIGLLLSAASLLMVFLGLEFLSLPVYVLVASRRHDLNSCEAGLKYFLFGSLSSVFLMLAIAVTLSACGSLYFSDVERLILNMGHGAAAVAIGLFVVVVAFKLGLAPFHLWLPDAYEGAPTPITGFMGSAVKLAGVAMALRLFWGPLLPAVQSWSPVLSAVSIAAMVVGSLGGLAQKNLKRLLAYSSISHAGYLALGVAVVPHTLDAYALWFYVLSYGVMFVGLMGAFLILEKATGCGTLDSLNGLGFKRPVFAFCMTVCVLSAAGIPPLAGFTAKYMLFLSVVQNGRAGAAVVAVLSSLVSVYFYLRIVVALYMTDSQRESVALAPGGRLVFSTLVLCAALLVVLGFAPNTLL